MFVFPLIFAMPLVFLIHFGLAGIASKKINGLEKCQYEIVDGFHRYTIIKKHKDIFDREEGLLPIVVIDKDISNRMASTIRHNRARGSHSVDLMSNIVAELLEMGKSDRWIAKHLGMDADELLRLKQITGLASLFKDKEFSKSWEIND